MRLAVQLMTMHRNLLLAALLVSACGASSSEGLALSDAAAQSDAAVFAQPDSAAPVKLDAASAEPDTVAPAQADGSVAGAQDAVGGGTQVRFTQSYGECMGLCQTTLVVGGSSAQITFSPNGPAAEPTVRQAVILDAGTRAAIFTEASDALASRWAATYGCPDCADQGRWVVEITTPTETRTVVLDPQDHPKFFDPLVDQLKAILAANPKPTSICASGPAACAPGKVSVVLTREQDGRLKPTWYNDTAQDIFLAGCTTVSFELQASGAWTPAGVAAMCFWEGVAKLVPAHTALGDLPFAPSKAGDYRAVGSYGVGCTPGQPLSAAACTGSFSVASNTVNVTAP